MCRHGVWCERTKPLLPHSKSLDGYGVPVLSTSDLSVGPDDGPRPRWSCPMCLRRGSGLSCDVPRSPRWSRHSYVDGEVPYSLPHSSPTGNTSDGPLKSRCSSSAGMGVTGIVRPGRLSPWEYKVSGRHGSRRSWSSMEGVLGG